MKANYITKLCILLLMLLYFSGCNLLKENQQPEANAGSDQVVTVGDIVYLDGSGSSDKDGDRLTYQWFFIIKPFGSSAVLSNHNTVKPSFVADLTGEYLINLLVYDRKTGADMNNVRIVVNDMPTPTPCVTQFPTHTPVSTLTPLPTVFPTLTSTATPTFTSTSTATPTSTPNTSTSEPLPSPDIRIVGAMWFVPHDQIVEPGVSFSTELHLNSGTHIFAAYGIDIFYDPAVIQYVSYAFGEQGFISAFNGTIPGIIKTAGYDAIGKRPGPDLHVYTLNWTTAGEGETFLGMSIDDLCDLDFITIGGVPTENNGRVIVSRYNGEPTDTSTPTVTPTYTPTVTPTPTVTTITGSNIWTIMLYMDGDNDLEQFAISQINEIEAVNLSGTGIEVIVLFDRIPGYDSSNGNWTNTRLYKIKYDTDGDNRTIISQRLSSVELGITSTGNEELNMGDPTTVSNFIDFCKANYQAGNYLFIFWNHGSGWRSTPATFNKSNLSAEKLNQIRSRDYSPTLNNGLENYPDNTKSGYRAVCIDYSNNYDFLYTKEIHTGITDKGIDIVGFDVCLGGMLEVAYELRQDAYYMIASEDLEPIDGWNYTMFLNNFISSARTKLDLIDTVVNAYQAYYSEIPKTTLSGIDLSKIDNLMTAFNNFSNALYNVCTNSTIQNNILETIYYDAEDFFFIPGDLNIDIWDCADELQTQWDYADAEAQALKNAVDNAIVAEWHNELDNPEAHGISVHFISLDSFSDPAIHDKAYWQGYNVSYPLSFVSNSTWVPVYPSGPGLLYRLWYETLP